jgi:hypothetical protein
MQQGADPNTAQRIAHDRLRTGLYANSQKNAPASNVSIPTQGAAGNGATPPPNAAGNAEVNAATASPADNAAGNAANNTAIPTGTTAVSSENPVVPSGNAGIPVNAAALNSEPTTTAVTPEPTTAVPFTETGIVDKPNTAQTSTQGFSPVNTAQQNMLLQTQNQQGTAQSEQTMLSDQNNFVDNQNSSDPSKQITPKGQRIDFQTNPTKQQLLEAEIDKAFNEVFETDQTTPTEDNPHAAVFDEMADDLYQIMLQEQAKEETAAGLTPIPNQAKALDSSTQGWTNNGNIQYNMQEEISAAPIAQQEYLRQFWDETKNRFSAVKLLFDTQPYASFQPAFAIGGSQSFYGSNSSDASSRIGVDTDQPNNAIKQISDHRVNSTFDIKSSVFNESGNEVHTKPQQTHHYATNKNKIYTPQFYEIVVKYGLNLDDNWNKDLFPHQGRHPNAYHNYVLNNMKQFDKIAQGERVIFLKLFDNLKQHILNNPEMLYKNYWIH